MAETKDSSRSKMLQEQMKEGLLKDITLGASRLGDRMGFTQEDKYKDKSMEELSKKTTVKKAKGGSISASKRADGIAQRGKTKGRMV